ncbi:hypothetical protein Tdes44962_MAKER02281 [Teratosphaeria destructans]|uniref:Uncharacterized protein n=1 Tax=Teratosphaeria destructans TaxID=418781 RepID=A0A9W7W3E8_9PEZI|nr:hypothetical protein Tdes44962_MAKER02281 [Teratosphaeria destructans]
MIVAGELARGRARADVGEELVGCVRAVGAWVGGVGREESEGEEIVVAVGEGVGADRGGAAA